VLSADFTGVTAYSQSGVVGRRRTDAGGRQFRQLRHAGGERSAPQRLRRLPHHRRPPSPAANDHGIFADGGNTTYAAIAREGDVAAPLAASSA